MRSALARLAGGLAVALSGMALGWGLTIWSEGRPWGVSVAIYPQPEQVEGAVTGWRVLDDGTVVLWSTAVCGEGR